MCCVVLCYMVIWSFSVVTDFEDEHPRGDKKAIIIIDDVRPRPTRIEKQGFRGCVSTQRTLFEFVAAIFAKHFNGKDTLLPKTVVFLGRRLFTTGNSSTFGEGALLV